MGILIYIRSFFTSIDYPLLWKSLKEVIAMTFIAIVPLIINIIIAASSLNDFVEPLKTKIIPGEIKFY